MADTKKDNVVRLPVRNQRQPSFAEAAVRLEHKVKAQAKITRIIIDDVPAETIAALASAGLPQGKTIEACARDVLVSHVPGKAGAGK